jgi:hypothetical protein
VYLLNGIISILLLLDIAVDGRVTDKLFSDCVQKEEEEERDKSVKKLPVQVLCK